MEWITDEEFEEAVSRVILQPLLVQAWMGYGGVTFFGFGDHIPVTISRWKRCAHRKLITRGKRVWGRWRPPYQLVNSMSYWAVLDENKNILGHSEGNRADAETTLAGIVGLNIAGFELYREDQLDIFFSTGLKLAIRPYPERVQPEDDLWDVREPGGFYYSVRRDGRTYRMHKHEPIYMKEWDPEWFSPLAGASNTLQA